MFKKGYWKVGVALLGIAVLMTVFAVFANETTKKIMVKEEEKPALLQLAPIISVKEEEPVQAATATPIAEKRALPVQVKPIKKVEDKAAVQPRMAWVIDEERVETRSKPEETELYRNICPDGTLISIGDMYRALRYLKPIDEEILVFALPDDDERLRGWPEDEEQWWFTLYYYDGKQFFFYDPVWMC